jgi:hypothetical protein
MSASGNPSIAQALLQVGGFLYVMAKALAAEHGRTAEDPPRDDFESATYPTPRRLDLEVFGEGPITTPAVALGHSINDATASMRAMVRALERAQGAEQRDMMDFAELRMREAERFAQQAATDLHRVTEKAEVLAQGFESMALPDHLEPSGQAQPRTIWTRLDEALPDSSLALLYRAGIRIAELRQPVRGTMPVDPAPVLAAGFRNGAESTERMSRELRRGEFDSRR